MPDDVLRTLVKIEKGEEFFTWIDIGVLFFIFYVRKKSMLY